MMRSINELLAAFRKAAVGAGYNVGLADDISRSGAWLCACGYDGASAVLDAVRAVPAPGKPPLATEDGPRWPDFKVSVCGPSLCDLAVAEGGSYRAKLHNVDVPLMLVGMIGQAASHYGGSARVWANDGPELSISGGGVEGKINAITECRSLGVAFDFVKPGDRTGARAGTVAVPPDAWAEIDKLARKTYVPATAESRAKGAGAGLTDND